MTDQHHGHHGHTGGHEVDAPPTRELFNIVWGLGALTLLSLVTCVQLFNNQARDLNEERGKEGSFVLAKYRQDMETRTKGTGDESLTDVTGKVVASYKYVPLASARELVLAKPERLQAFPAPAGWIHPDDLAAGGQGAAPTPTPGGENAPAGTPAAPADLGAAGGNVAPADGAGTAANPAGLPSGPQVDGQPGSKDEAQPINADKGQSESTKGVPGGTPEPVGAKSPVEGKPVEQNIGAQGATNPNQARSQPSDSNKGTEAIPDPGK